MVRDLPLVTVIGGAPGSGKTALARRLAAANPRGVHVETDLFFRSVAHRIDPSLPESQAQNATVVRAFAGAARAFADGGYCVFVDGVIGPWMLPLISASLPRFDYVLLHAPVALLLQRARARGGQSSATPEVVAHMHAQFEAVQAAWARHVVPVDGQTLDALEALLSAPSGDRVYGAADAD